MSSSRFKNALADSTRQRRPRVGTVVSVADGVAEVSVNGATVPAFVTDSTGGIAPGDVVTLLPIGDTFEVLSIRSGGTPAGLVLGPELIPNGGFEYGIHDQAPDHWTGYVTGPAVLTWDNSPGEALAGTARALVTLTPDIDAPDQISASAPIAVDDGVVYTTSVWVKASTLDASLVTTTKLLTAPTQAGCVPGDPSATEHLIANVSSPGAAYQFVTGNVTVPSGHNRARVLLAVTAAIGTALTVSWDEASLRQRVTP